MKKNRSILKEYFKKGAIPTEASFADLIDSMLNQEEDNIDKLPNDPLSITAIGADETLINFYRLEQSQKKLGWQFKQKAGEKAGLSIGDGAANRLFVESGTGRVGIGTNEPKQTLDVRGRLNVENGVIQRGGDPITSTSDLGLYSQVDKNWIRVVSTNAPIRFFNDGGIGTKPSLSIEVGSLTTGKTLLMMGTTDGSNAVADEVVGGIGFLGLGIQHGMLGFRAGKGFELVDRSPDAPSLDYKYDSYTYANLKVGNLQLGNSDLYFTKTDHNHTGFGNTAGYAAIENAKDYDALMILGRSGTNKGRKVRLWDYLEVNGELHVTGAQNIIKVRTFTLAVKNAGGDQPGKWSVDYSDTGFLEVYTVFVCMQGYSLFNNEGKTDFGNLGHVVSGEAIPQHAYVRITSQSIQKTEGMAFCSESKADWGVDNTVLFTVVVMGRV